MAISVIRRLKFSKLDDFKIICAGSVLVNNDLVRSEFNGKIKVEYPQAQVMLIEKEAAWGAVKLAFKGATIK